MGISEAELNTKYQEFCNNNNSNKHENNNEAPVMQHNDNYNDEKFSEAIADQKKSGNLKKIVLKFTTLSESGTDAPSFTVTSKGAVIGKDKDNEISLPTDTNLSPKDHARIKFVDGFFYLIDRGYTFGAGNIY